MSIKSPKVILPLVISTLVGCGGNSSVTSEGSRTGIINEDENFMVSLGYKVSEFKVTQQAENGVVNFSNETGLITYTPNLNYHGTDEFAVFYGDEDKKEKIHYTLTINEVNDAPVILTESSVVRTYHNLGENWELQLNFDDVEDDGLFFNPDEVENNKGKSFVNLEFNNLVLDEDSNEDDIILNYGEFSYNRSTQTITHVTSQERVDYEQTAVITIIDSDGVTVTKDLTIKVDYINEAPVYSGQLTYNILEDEVLTFNALESVSDSDGDELVFTMDTSNVTGSVVYTDGEITYTPPSHFYGMEQFDITYTDPASESVTETIVVNVTRTIDPLIVDNFTDTIDEDSSYDVTITYTDQENIPTSDINFAIKTQPQKGTIVLSDNGAVRYVPFENENGSDSFVINVFDNVGRSEDSLVELTITPINDPIRLISNIEYSTLGNIHFSGNISSFVEDVDGDEIRFVEDSYGASGATLEVAANGDINFMPPVGEKNKLYNFAVGATDSHLLRNINVSVLVEDRLIKIIDTDAIGSTNMGTASNPYTDAELAFTELSSGDEVYFCSNDIDVTTNFEIPSNVQFIGYDNLNKHEFIKYCQIENGNGTKLNIQDLVEITINSDLLLEGFKFNNLSTVDVIKTNILDLNNVVIRNISVTQVEPTAVFANIDNAEDLIVKNSIFYNGDTAFDINSVGSNVKFEDVIIEDINNPITIRDVKSNTMFTIVDSEISNSDIGVNLFNTNTYTGLNFEINNVRIENTADDAQGMNLHLEDAREASVTIVDSIIKSDNPVVMSSNISDGVDFELLNNTIMTSKNTAVFIDNADAGEINVLLNDNDMDVLENMDIGTLYSHVYLGLTGQNLISKLNAKVINNSINNTANYDINNDGNAVVMVVNVNADTAPVSSVIDIKNNVINPNSLSHIKINFDSSSDANEADINIIDNNLEQADTNSLVILEKNLIDSCLNLENNKMSLVDLNNEDLVSDISLYDPNNEMEVSVYNRQESITGYLPVVNYSYTFNKCKTNLE